MRGAARAAAGIAVLALLLGAAPSDVIPPDVQQVFDDEALDFVHRAAATIAGSPNVYEDADRIANITEVHAFTPEFLLGQKTDMVFRSTGHWIATVQAGFSSIGTVTVNGQVGRPTVIDFDGDADLGGALDEVTAAELVIEPLSSAAFAVYGDTIGPLNAPAAAIIPAPESIEDFQPTIAARFADGDSDDAPPLLEWVGIGVLALLLLGAGIAAVRLPRPRR